MRPLNVAILLPTGVARQSITISVKIDARQLPLIWSKQTQNGRHDDRLPAYLAQSISRGAARGDYPPSHKRLGADESWNGGLIYRAHAVGAGDILRQRDRCALCAHRALGRDYLSQLSFECENRARTNATSYSQRRL